MKPHMPAIVLGALLGPAAIPVVGFLYLAVKGNEWQQEQAMKAANPDHPDYQKKDMKGRVFPR
jgi:lipopolysaccharide export system protein LptC